MCHEFGQKPILEPWGRACTAVTGYMLSRARGKEPYSNASRRERVCGSTCRDEARVYTARDRTGVPRLNLCITGARLCGFRTRGRAGDCLVLLSPHRPRAERLDSHRSPVTGQHSRRTLSNTTTYTPHDPPPPSQAGADAGRRDYVAMAANYASLNYVDRCTYTAVCAGTGQADILPGIK